MKRYGKALIGTLAALLLLLSACAGNGGSGTPAPAPEDAGGAAETESPAASGGGDSGSGDSGGETVTFNIYKNWAGAEYPADGGPGKELIRETLAAYGLPNVDYNVTLIGGDDYFDKLNMLAASGSMPDYFSVNMVTMTNFADQGLIQPLEDHVDSLTHLRPLMRENELEAVTYNGHLYAFPVGYLPGAINGPNTNGLLVRKDWLDTLGLEIPTTLEELHRVMTAFKEQDPDGNGADDTTGYIATKTTLFSDIFGAFGVQADFWQEVDGKLVLGSTRPEAMEALRTLQDWYAEGLIDPDIFVTDDSLRDQKLANSYGGVYENSAFTASKSNPETAALLSVNPEAEMVAMPAIAGPEGLSGRAEAAPGYNNIHAISSNCQDTALLLKYLDWCADPGENGGMYLCSVGVEGTHFQLNEEETAITMLTSYDEIYAYGLGNPVRFVQVVDRRWLEPEAVLAFEAFAGMYTENKFWQTTPTMLDYPDTCKNLFVEYMSKIVMGSMEVEAGHAEYVERFYQMGGDKIEEEVNAAYYG